MDLILSLRQMMAESKFFEVQCEAHTQLSLNQSTHRIELIELYLESLEKQKKNLAGLFIIELAENYLTTDLVKTTHWLEKLSSQDKRLYYRRVLFLEIQLSEKQGKLQGLYQLISDYQIYLYEVKAPAFPNLIKDVIEKYFKNDFQLKLQSLALLLSLGNNDKAETVIKELLYSSVEKSSPKGIKEKLTSLYNVLKVNSDGILELYTNFCLLSCHGLSSKKDYKKIAEMIIHFDEFRLQVLTLDLMYKLGLMEEVKQYADSIKVNAEYDYVYLDKFFSHLKPYFFKLKKITPSDKTEEVVIDLKLDKNFKETTKVNQVTNDSIEEEKLLEHVIKYQDYSINELCEIAVSFLQSEIPKVALVASEMALSKSTDSESFLKASYLKLTALLLLGDFRAALDVSLNALGKAQNQADILSFMYGQAEAYLRLNENRKAKQVLSKIISIDASYRLAKERLNKINEI